MPTTARRCPGCANHCAETHLRCGTGQSYFLQLASLEEAQAQCIALGKPPAANDLTGQLRYSVELLRTHTPDELCAPLTAGEQKQLCALLHKMTAGAGK